MSSSILESTYPLSFRQKDASVLGEHIKNRHSVVLVGMKRVGISNFLRFFLYHKDISKTYINDGHNHLFIPIDLNDLVEREIYPFWVLTLKRIADTIAATSLPNSLKKHIEILFMDSIQTQDLFLTIDYVRKALIMLSEQNILPTLFFLRFDRMKDSATDVFFDNLQGLLDATHKRMSYVFTSVRTLDSLAPDVFPKSSVAVFAQNMYIKPASKKDIEVIFQTNSKQYKLAIPNSLEKLFLESVDGYIQYLQYLLIFLSERKTLPKSDLELFTNLVRDERIALQSEELWESLSNTEQETLLKSVQGGKLSSEDKKNGEYLWDTGFITKSDTVFSPLFEFFLKEKLEEKSIESQKVELSKKENQLLKLLEERIDDICEREEIIEKVWPEMESFGVSDWAIDRLVARLRNKLKLQKSPYEIVTVKTRGYKLVKT